jgi:hypothetical protein
MRIGFRHYLLDAEAALYHVPNAAFDRMLRDPVRPLSDRHVRARAELALALEQPIRDTAVADASTRFLARGGQWSPSAAVKRRIEQTALGRQKCGRV